MIRRIIAYILFLFGLLTVTFFRKYSGNIIPFPFLFWIIGIAMFIGGWALLRFTPTIKESKENEKIKILINQLIENGEKIIVDLSKCDIKTNNYTEEQSNYGGRNDITTLDIERNIQAWNALGGDSIKNTKIVEVYQSVLVYKNQHDGNIETFISRVINKEKTTLMFKLVDKKETILYIDKNDRSRYYFDLEFLNS
ncbi:MAG: hypothetical protein HXX18_02865 [Bacteroidetes bacterium]|nr:hypothetical protein [Bacteroidota bacterium]